MKKISQIEWKRYKESESGKKAISCFEKLYSDGCTFGEMHDIAKRFDPQFFMNLKDKENDLIFEDFEYFNNLLSEILNEDNYPKSGEDCIGLYNAISAIMTEDDAEKSVDDIPQSKFKYVLDSNMFCSIMLFAYVPDFFIPNLFVMQFLYLKKFADKYEIELPATPNRANYKDRWFYYIDICIALNNFAIENEIKSPAELCAFIYDYQFPLIKEDLENNANKEMPSVPDQAWILCGNMSEGEKTMKYGFWQANQLTRKGDLILFYEKSPVKKMNSVWRAQEDGVVDPFFHYYSNTYIGNRIDIPDDKAISYAEFKDNDYFKVENRGREGNYVSKNFQDVSGWEVTSDDYKEIKRMLEAKGFDTSILPSLYEPNEYTSEGISNEDDVYIKLVEPLLVEMGWERNKDFRSEVRFPAGRGKTDHEQAKRPDYCLHLSGTEKDLSAKVVIEAKYFMRNINEIEENYYQALSYAKWGNAQVLVLCDIKQIRVYLKDRKGNFDVNKYKRFMWSELSTLEKYNELKHILEK